MLPLTRTLLGLEGEPTHYHHFELVLRFLNILQLDLNFYLFSNKQIQNKVELRFITHSHTESISDKEGREWKEEYEIMKGLSFKLYARELIKYVITTQNNNRVM